MVKARSFTLLEIMICVAILGIVASVLTWQAKEMVTTSHFRKNVDMLMADLRKMQIVALSNRCDLHLELGKEKGKFSYQIKSDEPNRFFKKRKVQLLGLKEVKLGGKPLKVPLIFHVKPSGEITPVEKVELFQDQERGYRLDLETITPKNL